MPRLFQAPHHIAERRQAGVQLSVGMGPPHRGNRQRRRAPPFTPDQQQPRPVRPHRVPLRQRGQFGAMRRGLRPQFGRTQGEPVLVQHLEPTTARGEQMPRAARRLGPQRLTEPAAGPGQCRAAPPAACRRDEMTVGLRAPPQVACDPPGQQMGVRRFA